MPLSSFNTEFYPIDEKLFAHITSDAFLIGINLQGDNFSRIIGFLNHFFDLFYQDNISPDILKLKTALLTMKEREEQIKGWSRKKKQDLINTFTMTSARLQ